MDAAPNPPKARNSSFAARVLLLAASLLFTLGALEWAARYWLLNLAKPREFLLYASLRQLDDSRLAASRKGVERRYSPHRYLGYFPTPNYRQDGNWHNSLGFRGDEIPRPKPAGEFRIVCLGGSTTYTGRVDEVELTYPAQLEMRLRERGYPQVRVINAGAEGWGSWESLINLETRGLDLEPDLIVDYDGINDLHARLVWPPEAYRGDNSGRRAPNVSGVTMPGILEYSTLARILLVRGGRLEPHAELSRTIDRPAPSWLAPEFWRQWRHHDYPHGIFATVSVEQMLRANPPVYFRRNLESLVAVARAHGADTMLATFAEAHAYPRESSSSPEYTRGIEEMNEVVRQVAAATGAHLFDFAAVMPRGKEYFADGEHVNARGAAKKAELFAEAIVTQNLLPAPVAASPP